MLGVHELPAWIGAPLTVLGIVAIMNMVNFLDGLDGLAAGVCCISAATFTVIALDLGSANVAILAAIVVGATAGFLRHNFYPARIFMGDSGALLLGFLLAGISVQGLLKTASLVSLFLPLAVLAVPIIDTSFVVAKRLKHGLPVYESDRFHLHHRFLNIGYSQRRAVLTIYALVRDARRRRAGDALHPAAPARRLAPVGDCRGRNDRPRRRGDVDLHRLPARDREAREPDHAPPGAAAEDRVTA